MRQWLRSALSCCKGSKDNFSILSTIFIGHSFIKSFFYTDLENDETAVQTHLKNLTNEELKRLFRKLGLSHDRVNNNCNGSTTAYRDYLIKSWILQDDFVKGKGGATWESLESALRSEGKTGIADEIQGCR